MHLSGNRGVRVSPDQEHLSMKRDHLAIPITHFSEKKKKKEEKRIGKEGERGAGSRVRGRIHRGREENH